MENLDRKKIFFVVRFLSLFYIFGALALLAAKYPGVFKPNIFTSLRAAVCLFQAANVYLFVSTTLLNNVWKWIIPLAAFLMPPTHPIILAVLLLQKPAKDSDPM